MRFNLPDVEDGRVTWREPEAAQGQKDSSGLSSGPHSVSPTCQQPGLHRVPAPAAPAGPLLTSAV